MSIVTRLLFAFALLAVMVAAPLTADAAAKAPYCRWSLSSDHRLVTVHGPEGIAKIKVRTRHAVHIYSEEIDEGTAVHLFRFPHPASKISVKARAFTDRRWHLCARPKGI